MSVETKIEQHILNELKKIIDLAENEPEQLRQGVFWERFGRIARQDAKANPFTIFKALLQSEQPKLTQSEPVVQVQNESVNCPNCGRSFPKGKKALDGHMRVCKKK